MTTAKQYQVVGNHAVHGHQPGTRFAAVLAELAERMLVDAGHLRVIAAEPKLSKEKPSDEE